MDRIFDSLLEHNLIQTSRSELFRTQKKRSWSKERETAQMVELFIETVDSVLRYYYLDGNEVRIEQQRIFNHDNSKTHLCLITQQKIYV